MRKYVSMGRCVFVDMYGISHYHQWWQEGGGRKMNIVFTKEKCALKKNGKRNIPAKTKVNEDLS